LYKKPKRWLSCVGLMVSMMLPISAQAFLTSSGDDDWEEAEVELPAGPDADALREFQVSAASNNRFYVDESSLAVGEDGVVRYVLVVETPGGATNVTFEGIRCASDERRIYAMKRADGSWHEGRRSRWEPIGGAGYNNPRGALARQHFCDSGVPPRSTREALRGLRDGVRRW